MKEINRENSDSSTAWGTPAAPFSLIPAPLSAGDEVRIVSPSGAIDPACIDGARRVLVSWGLCPTEGANARARYGRFAGTPEQRLADLQQAFDDPRVKAVWCSRGGYGLAQIIDRLDFSAFCRRPKWLIGFSDITVLHSALTACGVCSLHAVMAKHLCELPAGDRSVALLKHLLFTGRFPEYSVSPHPLDRPGVATGRLVGGNLSVLYGLRGTPFDLDCRRAVLFIEDVGERPYHVDRMVQNLRLGGVFSRLSGLVVGRFSEADEDPLMMATVYDSIRRAVGACDFPVCFGFPVGHVADNVPLVVGAEVSLEVTPRHSLLRFLR